MSIFKATFKPYIQKQIIGRQDLVKSGPSRPLDLQKYVSAKSPWIKMTSFVDYGDPKKKQDPNDELARKYVLMGGTLYPDWEDVTKRIYSLRSGIKAKGSAYGTDLGYAGHDRVSKNGPQYGIRPMPGITSLDVKSKSAYGSLREATVKFYAWDVNQLEDLLILFMRPGYFVLLEWGWSMYLDTENKGNLKSFDETTINCFQPGLTQNDIYNQIENLQKQYAGNYSGMLGVIRNYETSMLPNGGFECTAVLISIGDVIDSLRMNTENGQIQNDADKSDQLQDEFEMLLRGFIPVDSGKSVDSAIQNKIDNLRLVANDINNKNISDKSNVKIDTDIYYLNNAYKKDATNQEDTPKPTKADNSTVVLSDTDLKGDKAYSYYMQLGFFINLLNNEKNLFYNKSEKLLNIEIPLPYFHTIEKPVLVNLDKSSAGAKSTKIPKEQQLNYTDTNLGNGLCIGSYESVTIDNSVCIIENPDSKILTDSGFIFPGLYNVTTPSTVKAPKFTQPGISTDFSSALNIAGAVPQSSLNSYLYDKTNLGIIGNIYISIGKIIEVYKKEIKNNNGFVYLGKFIKSLLKEIEFTLGSVNDFDISVQENRMIIIDKHYVEVPENTNKNYKFQINILGTDTIVRNEKIISKIFPSQATIIAIAAQSRKNVASLQSSTYSAMNDGLRSRILLDGSLVNYKNAIEQEAAEQENLFLKNLVSLKAYINNQILTLKNGDPSNLTSVNTFLNNFLVKYDKATEYKGIVPVSLDITLDGIGGITIGEIFTINKDILPREYNNKDVGFIVTRISNTVNRADWTTTLETQFCLLNQDEKQAAIIRNQADIKNSLNTYIAKSKANNGAAIALYNILASYVADVLYRDYQLKYNGGNNFSLSYKTDGTAIEKYLKRRLDENTVNFDGVNITVDNFLQEISLQMGLSSKKLTSFVKDFPVPPNTDLTKYFEIYTNQYNHKFNILKTNNPVFSIVDDEVLKNSKYYKRMAELSPDIKNAFDANLYNAINKNNNIFPLIDKQSSISPKYGTLNINYLSNNIELFYIPKPSAQSTTGGF